MFEILKLDKNIRQIFARKHMCFLMSAVKIRREVGGGSFESNVP